MLELFVMAMMIFGMVKVATMEGRSGWLWGVITFVICVVFMLIPLPFVRILFAGFASFIIMFVLKICAKPPERTKR